MLSRIEMSCEGCFSGYIKAFKLSIVTSFKLQKSSATYWNSTDSIYELPDNSKIVPRELIVKLIHTIYTDKTAY